jgi:hypothetical protein
LWSRRDPVRLFGAATGGAKSGWDELSPIFDWVASTFSDVSDFRLDVEVADVSGDLAYTVGYGRFERSIDGRPVASASRGIPARGWRAEDRPPPRRLDSHRSEPADGVGGSGWPSWQLTAERLSCETTDW